MGVVRRLTARLRKGEDSDYECGFCGLSFDREPQNCPACGSEVHPRGKL